MDLSLYVYVCVRMCVYVNVFVKLEQANHVVCMYCMHVYVCVRMCMYMNVLYVLCLYPDYVCMYGLDFQSTRHKVPRKAAWRGWTDRAGLSTPMGRFP